MTVTHPLTIYVDENPTARDFCAVVHLDDRALVEEVRTDLVVASSGGPDGVRESASRLLASLQEAGTP